MKNTGFSFFIIKTARLIVAMVVFFAICKPIAASVGITGVGNLAPNCDDKIKALCDHTQYGELKNVDVTPRECKVTCTYRPDGDDTVLRDGAWVKNRKYIDVPLPEGMPCGFGAACTEDRKCFCDFCNKIK
uniref:Putative salp15 n=1 Tax=Ixodes ricinus TaxID=34613 RepID=A0A0K8RHY2_IXORI